MERITFGKSQTNSVHSSTNETARRIPRVSSLETKPRKATKNSWPNGERKRPPKKRANRKPILVNHQPAVETNYEHEISLGRIIDAYCKMAGTQRSQTTAKRINLVKISDQGPGNQSRDTLIHQDISCGSRGGVVLRPASVHRKARRRGILLRASFLRGNLETLIWRRNGVRESVVHLGFLFGSLESSLASLESSQLSLDALDRLSRGGLLGRTLRGPVRGPVRLAVLLGARHAPRDLKEVLGGNPASRTTIAAGDLDRVLAGERVVLAIGSQDRLRDDPPRRVLLTQARLHGRHRIQFRNAVLVQASHHRSSPCGCVACGHSPRRLSVVAPSFSADAPALGGRAGWRLLPPSRHQIVPRRPTPDIPLSLGR